jgi:hypothetical protein
MIAALATLDFEHPGCYTRDEELEKYDALLPHTTRPAHPTTPPEARLGALARVKEAHPTRCTGSTARRVLFCP